jgi:Fe-S-cluster containining protein
VDEFTYSRGNIVYKKDDKDVIIYYYYPNNVTWSCIDCGDCCGDINDHTRMILLLPEDIDKIENRAETDFYEEWNGDNFVGILCKKDGKCIFYNGEGCSIYEERALLCRMYPFWVEKQNDFFVVGIDKECQGKEGEILNDGFFSELLLSALKAMKY